MEAKDRLVVFISHAHEEAKLALMLKECITQDFLGLVKVFVSSARQELFGGDDWLLVLKEEISKANVHAVLCSNRSLMHPWVNIELGGAWCRSENPPRIVPICHSGVNRGVLEPPLQAKQAITLSDVGGLQSLYELLANEVQCLVPAAKFDSILGDIRTFETEYKVSTSRQEQSERLSESANPTTQTTIRNPKVLCISSKQFEEAAKVYIEMIRKALPVNLHHEVVVTSEELSNQLGMGHYDIIHVALYVCPITGDLVFSDLDMETRKLKTKPGDCMRVDNFAKLIDVAGTSLLVITTPEPFGFMGHLLPHTNIVFPSGIVEPQALAKWMEAFYGFLAKSLVISEACKRASALFCGCMRLFPMLPKDSSMAYPSDSASESVEHVTQ
jgi:hypothetical protein